MKLDFLKLRCLFSICVELMKACVKFRKLHFKKTKNKELQKLTECEHGTAYKKNANEEHHGKEHQRTAYSK